MNVFITGIRGFLGSNLAQALEARGHTVRGSSRSTGPAVFGDADTIVHCAYDFRPGSLETNVAEARLVLESGKGRHRIFVSSHSARADALGEYGISKYRIECLFLEEQETVVRPGLVIGAGGLFGRQLRMMRNARIIPLVDGGRDAVPVIAIPDFCDAMVTLIESGRGGVYNLFNERMPSMREIVETVLRAEARRALLIPVPYGVASAAVIAAERLHLSLPFNSGSLRTLKLNRERVHTSNLRELLPEESTLESAIDRALWRQSEGTASSRP